MATSITTCASSRTFFRHAATVTGAAAAASRRQGTACVAALRSQTALAVRRMRPFHAATVVCSAGEAGVLQWGAVGCGGVGEVRVGLVSVYVTASPLTSRFLMWGWSHIHHALLNACILASSLTSRLPARPPAPPPTPPPPFLPCPLQRLRVSCRCS